MRPSRTWRGPPKATRLKPVKPTVAGTIQSFSDERRNAVRGAMTEARRQSLAFSTVNKLRNNTLESDMVAAARMLEAPDGLRSRKVFGVAQEDISLAHGIACKSPTLEIAYACGYLNCWKTASATAIETIALLARLTAVDMDDAIGALTQTAQRWGASNYLSLKLTHLKEFCSLTDDQMASLRSIDELIGHKENPVIQYAAFEGVKPSISIFVVARRYTNILIDKIDDDFRRFYVLNSLLSTPINHDDCAGFVLRSVENSLIDTVRCIWLLLNLKDRLPAAWEAVERNLDQNLLDQLLASQAAVAAEKLPELCEPPAVYDVDNSDHDDEDRSLSYYRRSSAFLEFPDYAHFRQDIDRVIGHRLLASLMPKEYSWCADEFSDNQVLSKPDGNFSFSDHKNKEDIDNFYRTYLFLRLIQNPTNLALISSEEIRFIFNNTMRLDALLSEHELSVMHLNASDDARALISVLALALYRSKSSDPDIDFDFRANLEEHVLSNYGGKISDFIDDIAPKSPSVANYIVWSLDEVTLQKMYQIVSSPSEAEGVRKEILTTVGIHLNNIDYIIEAEGIETRSKVAKLKSYFDGSRMYVDSVAMKKWLSSNPSAYAEQYKELLPKLIARLSSAKSIVSPSGKEATVGILQITSTDIYLVERMATEAFREFCVNNEFGIESYLGRRIRHNTLQGVMTQTVDAVLQRLEYQPDVPLRISSTRS